MAALLSTAVLPLGPGQAAKVTRTGAEIVAITTGVTLPAAILPAAALRVHVKLASPATPVQAQLGRFSARDRGWTGQRHAHWQGIRDGVWCA